MQKQPDGKVTWKDWVLMLGVLLTVAVLLFAPLLAKADEGASNEALVLICPRDNMDSCTIATARTFFKVRVESAVPSGCLALAMAKAAEVSDMWSKEEAPKIVCGR